MEIIVERGSGKDRYFLKETEMWILLTLHRQDCPNHLESGFRKNRDLAKGERSKFQLLTIDKIGQHIADDWSWNEKLSGGESREFHSLWSMSLSWSLSTADLENKGIQSMKTGVNFSYFWISGIVQITADCRSRKYRHWIGDSEVNCTYFRSTGLSGSLSTHGSGKEKNWVDEDRSEFQ